MNNVVIAIFVFYLFTFVLSHYRVAYKKLGKIKFWRWKTFADLIVVLSLVVGFVLLVNYKGEKKFDNPYQMIDFGMENKSPKLIIKGCQEIIANKKNDIDIHFLLAKKVCQKGFNRELNQYVSLLYEMSKSADRQLKDIAYLMLCFLDYHSNYQFGYSYIDYISNDELKYFEYLKGLKASDNSNDVLAIIHFNKELDNLGFVKGALSGLFDIYSNQQDVQRKIRLVENPDFSPYFSRSIKREVAFNNGNVLSYLTQIFGRILDQFTLLSALTAFIISFLWMNFLRRFDIYEAEKWMNLIVVFIAGAAFTFLVYPLSDFCEYFIGLSFSGASFFNDLIYCSIAIGLVEELAKIIPFLLVLRFFKFIKEPYDFILYAAVSALGFAFVENILYFKEYQFHVIFIRSVYSVVGHMFWSSIIAYALIKIKFNNLNRVKSFNLLIGAIIIASFGHGLYDLMLFYELASLTTIFFFMSLIAFVLMINNSLNISNFYNYEISLRREKIAFQLIIGLIGVYMFQYFIIGLNHGSVYANNMAIDNMPYGLMVVTFLAILFSTISIKRGEWKAISVFSFIPYFTFTGLRSFIGSKNSNGLKLRFFTTKTNPFLAAQLPVVGNVVKELKVSNQMGWYLVEFQKPISVRNYLSLKAIVRPMKANTSLRESKIKVEFLLIPNALLLEKEEVLKTDFFAIDRVYTICLS
ncbi:MAG: PrsW family intramembrane metalloprotease [Parvicellaceae bacterium]